MKTLRLLIATILLFTGALFAAPAYAISDYLPFTALTGGTSGCLDAEDGSTLADGDKAVVITATQVYFYNLDADSAAAESSPSVISPDTNAGDKRWILVSQASTTISGMVELATDAETITGTATGVVVTPANLTAKIDTDGTLAGNSDTRIPSQKAVKTFLDYDIRVYNLKPVVNASVNKLDIFTKSGGAAPDASNPIVISLPDGNGFTNRTRNATYLSGTSQFILADAANYWSKGSLDAEIKTAYIYAIWDGTGIVWALAGYSGFTMVPTTTTVTDDDYFLLEASSTYTRSNAHYCVAVAKIRYQYDTADTPDHTIQATVENAPQVIWNPKSDYGYQKNLATTITSASDIAEASVVSVVVKQSGKYDIYVQGQGLGGDAILMSYVFIKTGSATYGSASYKGSGKQRAHPGGASGRLVSLSTASVFLNAGDTIHLGAFVGADTGNRQIIGDDVDVGVTTLKFGRRD